MREGIRMELHGMSSVGHRSGSMNPGVGELREWIEWMECKPDGSVVVHRLTDMA